MAAGQLAQRSHHARDRTTSQELKNLETKIDEQRAYVNERFDHIDERFTSMDQRFTNMDERFTNMDERFTRIDETSQRLSAILRNANATTSWSPIEPIGTRQASGSEMRYVMPPWFPSRVRIFWDLRKPGSLHILISLLQFYDIRGLETWKGDVLDSDSAETDSDDSPASVPSLESIVREHPLLALHALAQTLGLPFESIKLNMEIQETLDLVRTGRESHGRKRHPIRNESQDESAVPTAKRKLEHTPLGDSEHAKHEDGSIVLAGVPISPSMFSSESWTPRSHVGWARPSESLSERGVVQDQSSQALEVKGQSTTAAEKSLRRDSDSSPAQKQIPLLSPTEPLSGTSSRKDGSQKQSINVGKGRR